MVFWFVKEFVKAVAGMALILGLIVFIRWISDDD